MDIVPILDEDSQLTKFQKTGRNLLAHAANGLRAAAPTMFSNGPWGQIAAGLLTPTENYAQQYGLRNAPLRTPAQTFTQDLLTRAAGMANRGGFGIPAMGVRFASSALEPVVDRHYRSDIGKAMQTDAYSLDTLQGGLRRDAQLGIRTPVYRGLDEQ